MERFIKWLLIRGPDDIVAHVTDRVKSRIGSETHVEFGFRRQREQQHRKRVDAQVIDEFALETDRRRVHT